MKKFWTIFLCLGLCILPFAFGLNKSSYASDLDTIAIENNDYRLQADYLNFYSIPTSHFSYTNNGGAMSGNELSKAFDRNFSTSFKSAQDNNVSYTDPDTNQTTANFINTIDVGFSTTVKLNRIIYGAENGTTRGFPTDLNLYADKGNGFELIKNYKTTATTNFVVFEFDATEMQAFRFEYVKVVTSHKYCATAREIIFLQPESDLFSAYQTLFTDYAETSLNLNFNTFEKVVELDNQLKQNLNYDQILPKLTRAKEVALHKLNFDPRREFSTSSSAQNEIARYGNIANYSRSINLNAFGTNRQVTGILSTPGQQVTIYVDALDSDPLPKIRFSQHVGFWNSWLGGELQLKKGKNTFTTPNFKNDNYTIDVALGGPIYLCNPYTETEQSANVKVYIEGGSFYPVLKKTTDENKFKTELSIYAEKVSANPSQVVDVMEIQTDHIIATATASEANKIYQTTSPHQACLNWDEYMDALLEFGGIPQNSDDPLFDARNQHVNVNIRVVQPWSGAGAYAYTEHIGVYYSWQAALIKGSGFGWGISHEIGHMMDNPQRTIGESTNNMYAKFNETALEKLNTRGEFSKTLSALAPDTNTSTSFFNTNRLNFLVWWYIESWHKGYWGELENCYRGLNPNLKAFLAANEGAADKLNTLTRTEKHVLFSSIATGVDLGYYFSRWGFTLTNDEKNDPVFNLSSTSQAYADLMALAQSSGTITNTIQPKLWYQNNLAYHNTNTTPIYSSSSAAAIKSVEKTSEGYIIFANHTPNANHLGYEIWEGDDTYGYKVIGFTYGTSFTDNTSYASSYTPTYKLVAVDNTFSTSAPSLAVKYGEQTSAVCKIGEVEYTSLQAAVDAAQAGDTILLIKSFNSQCVTIGKNLTITIVDNVSTDIVITKIESGNLISISAGVTVEILGNLNTKIVLDGNGFSQNGGLVSVAGKLTMQNVELRNNISEGKGGAVIILAGSQNSSFINCSISNNTATAGAAILCDAANTSASLSGVVITGNSSQAGIVQSRGRLTLTDCEIKSNTSVNGALSNVSGGIMYLTNCQIANNTANFGAGVYVDGYTEITSCNITNNTASQYGGGIYYSTTVNVRQLKITSTTISANSANLGADIYVNSGTATLNGATIQSNGDIYIFGGNVLVSNTSNIAGSLSIKCGANFTLTGGLFTNIEACKFNVIKPENGACIVAAQNFNLTDEDLSKIHLTNALLTLKIQNNAAILSAGQASLTIKFGEEQITTYHAVGEEVILDADLSSTQYASLFVDEHGATYNPGESLTITSNLTLTAQLKDKVKIDFVMSSGTQSKLFVPYAKIQFPSQEDGSTKIVGWASLNAFYLSSEIAVADKNTSYTAVYERQFKLTLMDGDNVVFEKYYEFGTTIDLTSCYTADNLSGWLLGDQSVGLSLTIEADTILTAQFKPKTPTQPSSKLVPILTISFVAIFALGVVILVLIKKHKAKKATQI